MKTKLFRNKGYTSKRENQRLYLPLLITGLLVLFGWSRLAEAMPLTDKQRLGQAWRAAADIGRYEYQTSVLQTFRPTARLENAGRNPRRQQLRAEGWVNRPDNAMQLRLWSSETSQQGIEIKVEGERAYGRLSTDKEWTDIPNSTDIFAPGGDPLGFLVAAENVRVGSREWGSGELTLDEVMNNPQLASPDFSVATSYAFDLNGPRYADHIRDQVEAAMRERGELPPGVSLGLVRQFAGISGHGEIWLNDAGLPVWQVIHLEFPAEPGALDRMDADITTYFGSWEVGTCPECNRRGGEVGSWENPGALIQQFFSPETWREVSLRLGINLLLAALAVMFITYSRSRKFYGAVALTLIVALVLTPLLQSQQVYAFNQRQQQRQAEFEQQQAAAQSSEGVEAVLNEDFDPHSNPLEAGNAPTQALASQSNVTFPTCHDDVDSDGDRLSDHVECYKLDTITDTIDSDVDSISDYTEAKGFNLNNQRWYLNPRSADSNNDGLLDAMECPSLTDVVSGTLSNPSSNTCVDTDGDGTPDVFDFDNDGDLVPDSADISPFYNGSLSSELQHTFDLVIEGYENTDRPLVVEFQLRPPDTAHLFQTNNVLNWPGEDTQGQIRRVRDNNLASAGYIGSHASQGDILLAPMLEITLPDPADNPDNPSGGLPVEDGFGGEIRGDNLDEWLDTEALDDYGISVSQNTTDNTLVTYLQLAVAEDATGSTPVAWGTQMLYRPGSAPVWGEAHQVRMVWLVQMLVDSCDTSDMTEDDDYDDWCSVYNKDHWLTELKVVQTYYEDFTLTGLNIYEDYGTEIAVMAQTNALTADYEDYLWHLGNALQYTFGEGQLLDTVGNDGIGDVRFDFDEIANRFGGSSGTVWDIPVSSIVVDSASYVDQVDALKGMIGTQIPGVLTTTYPSASPGDAVTLLFAREETYKTAGLHDPFVEYDAQSSTLNISLNNSTQQTFATINAAPYECEAVGEWTNMDLYDYVGILEGGLDNAITEDEISDMLEWFGETGDELAILKQGAIGQARSYYTTLYLGATNLVEDATYGFVNRDVVDEDAPTLDFDGDGQLDEAALVIVAPGLGLLKIFFQREGDLILDEINEILLVLGLSEIDLGEHEASLTEFFVVSGISLLKGAIKKAIKQFYTVEGSVKFYKYRAIVTNLATAATVTSVALLVVNELEYGGKNQALNITAHTLAISAAVLGAANSVYTFYRYTQHFGLAAGTYAATQTVTKLKDMTRLSAGIGLALQFGIALTIFIFSIKNAKPGSYAFNAALALLIAQMIVAIIMAIIAATIIGSLIVSIIGLIDAVIMGICKWVWENESEDVKTWFCGGITGAFTQAIAYAIYDQHVLVDMGRSDRMSLALNAPNPLPLSGTEGYVQGNALEISAVVTTTIKFNPPPKGKVIANSFTNDQLKRMMRRSVYGYVFQSSEVDTHDDLSSDTLDWDDNVEIFEPVQQYPFDEAGVNYVVPVYLTEGAKIGAVECWGVIGASKATCDYDPIEFSTHIYLGDDFVLDILPATFDGFISLTESENHSYRLSWDERFPTQVDADGDGLRSSATGGPDPDDSTWDVDGDGLSDFWELDHGFDPYRNDGDNDGLSDYWEAFYETNPRKADSDGDGLPDGAEFFHSRSRHPFQDDTAPWTGGWHITYGYSGSRSKNTRVSSDPLAYDTDMDSLSDNRERIYGYNPNAPSVLNILTLNSEIDANAVAPGATLGYTATIKNELDGRILNGLLQAEFPVDVVQTTEVMDTLYPLDTVTMTGSVNVPSVTQSQVASLTIRAGVVVSAPQVIDAPPGPVFFLDEFVPQNNQYIGTDDSGYGHRVSCGFDGLPCPSDDIGFVNDGFGFNNLGKFYVKGNDALRLGANDNTFTMMMWIYPQNDYAPDIEAYGETGKTILGWHLLDNPEDDFPSLTIARYQYTDYASILMHFGHADGRGYCLAPMYGILNHDEWQHLTVAFDGAQTAFYVNGRHVGSTDGYDCAGERPNTDTDFMIGHAGGMFVMFDELRITDAKNDEGYLWSPDVFDEPWDSNDNDTNVRWYSGGDDLDDDVVIDGDSIDSIMSTDGGISYWMCNRDEDLPAQGCLSSDNNDDEALYYDDDGSTAYERYHSQTATPGTYTDVYKRSYPNFFSGNKWGAELTYNLYSNDFRGKLDEIALYNTALFADTIEELYLAALRMADLTFDEPPGQDTFEDATAYDVVATCSGSHCPDSGIPGRDNQALRFDGVDDYVRFAQPLDPQTQAFTAATWFKINDLSVKQRILQQLDGTGDGRNWISVLNDGQLRTYLGGTILDSGLEHVVTPGRWHHVAVTSDGSQVRLYLDGQLAASTTAFAEANDGDLVIGTNKNLAGNFFGGLIDKVVVQREALDQDGVAKLMLEVPVLNLHLDENLNYTTFVDDTPYDNTATCTGNACPGTGYKGQMREAPAFDGNNDKISADITNVGLDDENFSIALWVKPQVEPDREQRLVQMDHFKLYLAPGSTQINYFANMCGTRQTLTGPELKLNEWNHVVVTVDRDAVNSNNEYPRKLYVNGAVVDQAYQRPIACAFDPGVTLGDDFAGNLDEVTVYGDALRSDEVWALYDYQLSWYDQVHEHRVQIDADDPQVSLNLSTDYLVLQDIQLGITAVDTSTAVSLVQVTLTEPGGGSTTVNATRSADPGSTAWFYTFAPSMAGQYTIELTAYDIVSNTASSSRTFYVDDTPPSASLSPALTGVLLKTSPPASEGSNVLTLYGPTSDPGSPASGVVTNSVSIQVLDPQDRTVAGQQPATYTSPPPGGTEGGWQVDYPFADAPYGLYQVQVDLADQVGNVFSSTLGAIILDGFAPTADLIETRDLLTETGSALSGTVTDIPYPSQNRRMFLHFEESPGATQFVDGTRSRAATACVGDCPTAGQSGQYGSAVSFDGTNDTLTATTTINPISDTFTAMTWFNLADTDATYTLLAQDGGASWLSTLSSGQLNTTLGGADLTGVSSVIPGQWHHAAVSYDGDVLRLYLDGTLEVTATRSLAFNDGDLVIGADGSLGARLDGELDELLVYDTALTAKQLYNIVNPLAGGGVTEAYIRFRHLENIDDDENAGTWYTLTLAAPGAHFGAWTMTMPSDLEGLYKIDLKASDQVGNTGYIPNVWQGNIDLAAPRLTYTYDLINDQVARAECYAYDLNITPSAGSGQANWLCPAESPQAIAESADWFVQTFTDTIRTTAYATTLQTVSALSKTLQACDVFGHCATITDNDPPLADAIVIITPTETTVYTGLVPIEIAGYARSDPYLLWIKLLADGQTIYNDRRDYTETHFSTLWTPDRPGTYVLEAVMQPRYGYPIIDPVDVTVQFNAPMLSVAKTFTPTQLNVGDFVTYTVAVTNSGDITAEGLRITDTLPAYLSGTDLDQTIDLPAGASVSYTIPAQVISSTPNVANTAWVSHTWQRISALAYDFHCDRFEVMTNADSGPGSLRFAIDNTCGASTITFADDFTITLQSQLRIEDKTITIDGSGHDIVISGDRDDDGTQDIRVFNIRSGSAVTLTHLTIQEGKPGIENRGTLRVFDSTLRWNNARAIYHNSAQPLIVSDSTFADNLNANSGSPYGGGIYLGGGGAVTITNSTLSGNQAYEGGGIYNNDSAVVIRGSHFHNNTARANGGGIRNHGVMTVTNSTFSHNRLTRRGQGAAMFNAGSATVIHATFARNRTAHGADTSDIYHQSDQPLLLANSILANRARGKNCADTGSEPIVLVNTLIEDGTCSPTFSGDPALAALGDYGGATETMLLGFDSPARDAADPAYCPAADQRGLSRPVGAACDLGAFESQLHLLASGSDQSASLAMTFSQPLSVTMSNNGTNEPLGNPSINFSAPASGPSLSPSDFSGTLDAQGHYSASVTANTIPGSYLVTATVPAIAQSVTFSLTNQFVDLVITKTATPTLVLQDQPLTYTLVFSNIGDIDSGPVTIQDLVPSEFVAQDAVATVDDEVQITQTAGVTYQWTLDNLAPGQGGVITLTGLVASDAILAQSIVNQADISSAHTDADSGDNQSTVTRLVACYPVNRLYVDADATGTARGTSWANAYTTVQDGLTAARTCGYAQEIWVAAGVYYPDEGAGKSANNRNLSFDLVNGVAMYGGFAGGETLLSERDVSANLTILSGDMGQNDDVDATGVLTETGGRNGTNSRYVVRADNVDSSTVLDGFIITAGQADGGRDGGGLHAISASPTLNNLVFSGNLSGDDGGGMYCRYGDLSLTNVTFAGNRADDGGGLNIKGSRVTLDGAVFSGNRAFQLGGHGGGIRLDDYGGASAVLTVTNGVFSGNDASMFTEGRGGGIYNNDGQVTLVNVSFASNGADWGGSAMFNGSSATAVLTNAIVWDNACSDQITGNAGTSISIDHSLIQGGCPSQAVCTDVITNDPRFVSVPDWLYAPIQSGDLRLFPNSPAIDSGTNVGAPDTDLRGESRPHNGIVDLGAYETQGFGLAYSGSDQLAVIGNTFLEPLVVTITTNADDAVGPGYVVTFTAPSSGASLSDDVILVQTDAAGVAELKAVANGITGSYVVTAVTKDVSGSASFDLTNTQASLTLEKQVSPSEAIPGEVVTYTLSISNGGAAPVSGLVITDFIPTELSVQQVISSGDMAINHTGSSPTAETFSLDPLPASGSGVITLTAQVGPPAASGPLQNTAVLTSPTLPADSAQQSLVELTVLNVGPVLTATYTFTTSEGAANGTVVGTVTGADDNADVLIYSISGGNPDDAFAINSGTGQIQVNDRYSLDYETLDQHVLTIEASDGVLTASTTVTVNLTDADGNLWLNKAVDTGLLAEYDEWDDYVPPTEYLATPGGILTYTLDFGNSGSDAVSGILITDTLPAEVSLISYTFSLDNGGAVTLTNASPPLWEVSELAPGEGGVITFTGLVSTELGLTDITNYAVIGSPAPDSAPGNNDGQVTVRGCAHEIEVQNNARTGDGSLQRATYDACEGARITFASDMTITPIGDTEEEGPYYINLYFRSF
jgi:uncharacterized repeat protein (TIGR01451 family)